MSREFWTLGGLAGLLAILVGTTFGTTAVTTVAFVFSAVLALRRFSGNRDQVEPPDLMQSGLVTLSLGGIAAIAWRLPEYANETANPILAGSDTVGHAMLFACLIWWVLRPCHGHVLMLGSALLLVLATVIAGGIRQSLIGQLTLGVFTTAGFLTATSVILRPRTLSPQLMDAGPSSITVLGMRSKTLFSLVVATGMLTGTSLLARATSEVLPDVQKILQDRLNGRLEDLAETIAVRGTRYVRGSRLGTIREHMLAAPEEIALRVYAESTPGYLRGHVFHHLEDSDWSPIGRRGRSGSRWALQQSQRPVSAGLATTLGPRSGKLNRFDLRKQINGTSTVSAGSGFGDDLVKTLEVHNLPEKGNIVFVPLTAIWIEASARSIRLDINHRIVGGVDFTEPYVIGLTSRPRRETLDPERRRKMLRVSNQFKLLTDSLARQLCRPDASPREKAAAISSYFQGNFEYSIDGVVCPPGTHPLEHFLRIKHPAHCEFFATATAMILRSAGVPTRYVTGYVANEKSVEEDYYMARNRDSHAWVEAYDDSTRRWFAVESTPGRRYSTLSFDDDLDNSTGLDGDGFNRLAGSDSGWLASIQELIVRSGLTRLFSSVFRYAQLPLFIALLALVWYRNHLRAIGSDDPAEIACTKMLRRVDKRLRRHQLIRKPNETLHQFAERVEAAADRESASNQVESRIDSSQELERMANWYRDFAVARYTGALPESPTR